MSIGPLPSNWLLGSPLHLDAVIGSNPSGCGVQVFDTILYMGVSLHYFQKEKIVN